MSTLILGDCLEELDKLESGSVDMVLCDPPYCSGGRTLAERQSPTSTKYTAQDYNGARRLPDFSGDTMDQRSFMAFMRAVLLRCHALTKPGGIAAVFVDWRNLPALTDALQAAGWIWRGIVVWEAGGFAGISTAHLSRGWYCAGSLHGVGVYWRGMRKHRAVLRGH